MGNGQGLASEAMQNFWSTQKQQDVSVIRKASKVQQKVRKNSISRASPWTCSKQSKIAQHCLSWSYREEPTEGWEAPVQQPSLILVYTFLSLQWSSFRKPHLWHNQEFERGKVAGQGRFPYSSKICQKVIEQEGKHSSLHQTPSFCSETTAGSGGGGFSLDKGMCLIKICNHYGQPGMEKILVQLHMQHLILSDNQIFPVNYISSKCSRCANQIWSKQCSVCTHHWLLRKHWQCCDLNLALLVSINSTRTLFAKGEGTSIKG